MSKRKRKHISVKTLLAAALAALLPQEQRDQLRRDRVPADTVIRLFTPDHVALHAFGGSDLWWNLDMRLRGADLKAKDAADTSRAAKAVRIDETWSKFTRALASRRKPPKRKSRWARRPFKPRPTPRSYD